MLGVSVVCHRARNEAGLMFPGPDADFQWRHAAILIYRKWFWEALPFLFNSDARWNLVGGCYR